VVAGFLNLLAPIQRPYREALVNEWLPTRLGDGSVTVAVQNLVSPFTGQTIETLPIPGRWLRGAVLPDEAIKAVGSQMRVGAEDYIYDRLRLQRLGPRAPGQMVQHR
jgi:hypothetical protein